MYQCGEPGLPGGEPCEKPDMHSSLALVSLVVATAVVFDYTNGFHDTANAMATTIATRALPPRIAVGLASLLNFAGAFVSVSVAATIAKGIVDQKLVTVPIVFAGLVGAILWNVVTWYLSIPSSSSHALIGGVVGSMLAAVGSDGVVWSGIASKVVIPAVLAPIVCGAAAFVATRLSFGLTRRVPEGSSGKGFRLGQIASSSLVALAHGTNDAQKTMGVVVLTLVAGGRLGADAGVPTWVKIVCAAAIAAGTFSGGWRVIRTLGVRVTEIASPQGYSAESSSSATILASSYFGFSLSTTHVVSGGIIGSGLGRPGGFVRWSVVRDMATAWVLTLPAAGLVGATAHEGVHAFSDPTAGVIVIGLVALAICGLLFLLARQRGNVTASNVVAPPRPAIAFDTARAAA
jgi:PiT family inorganic phosphate transporter